MFSNKQLIYTSLFLVHWLLLIDSGRAASSTANNSISIDLVASSANAGLAGVSENGAWSRPSAGKADRPTKSTLNSTTVISGPISSTVNPSNSSIHSTLDPVQQANGFNLAINQKDANNSAPAHRAESINSQIGNSTNISSHSQTTLSVQSNQTSSATGALAILPNNSGWIQNSKRNQTASRSVAPESSPETMAKSTTDQNKLIVKKAEQTNNAKVGALSEQPSIDRKQPSKQGSPRQDNTSSLIEDRLVTNEKQSETELGNQSVKVESALSGRIGEKQSVDLRKETAKNESFAINPNNLKKSSTKASSSLRPPQENRSKGWKIEKNVELTINHAANQTENRTNSQVANRTIEPHSGASGSIVLGNRSNQTPAANSPTGPPEHEQSNVSLVDGPHTTSIQPLHLSNAEPLISGAPHSGDPQHWMLPSQLGMYFCVSCIFHHPMTIDRWPLTGSRLDFGLELHPYNPAISLNLLLKENFHSVD